VRRSCIRWRPAALVEQAVLSFGQDAETIVPDLLGGLRPILTAGEAIVGEGLAAKGGCGSVGGA
jgi:hypothetical protein